MPSTRAKLPLKELLYQAIKEASVASSDKMDATIPGEAKTREIARKILSLPENSPVHATAEEMDLFGMVCWLMATKNHKWLSTSYAALPTGGAASLVLPAQKLIARLVIDPQSSEQSQLLDGHNDLVSWLHRCLPASEISAYPLLLALSNTSEGFGGGVPSRLPPAIDANAWYVLRACQDDLYTLTGHIPAVGLRRPGMSDDDVKAEAAEVYLRTLLDLFKARLWRHLPATDAPVSGSLFARLITQLAVNRFVQIESDMDRLARTSASLQEQLVQTLINAGHTSIAQIIEAHQAPSGMDYSGMAAHALKPLIEETGKTISAGLAHIIDRQADAIVESCYLQEFAGETLNDNLLKDPATTKAIAWLVLVWADATVAGVDNEDPYVHKKKVRLISQRTSIQTQGQGMMLRRRIVSSLLVSNQMQELSLINLRRQNHFSQSIRLACRDAIISTFKTATLDRWQSIFDMFGIGNLMAPHPIQGRQPPATASLGV